MATIFVSIDKRWDDDDDDERGVVETIYIFYF